MATPDTSQLESLPLELLEKITEQLPIPDILGLKQVRMIHLSDVHTISSRLKVNRGFRDLIRGSVRIQHKLDLYATGLVPNWATGVTVADSVKALGEYRSNWDNCEIDYDQPEMEIPSGRLEFGARSAGGVYGMVIMQEILLVTLPSNSRAIQSRKQTISLDFRVMGFAFHPQADVIVVAGQTGHTM